MKNRIKPRILSLVVATGIASVVGQLVFLREFLSQFQGNEIVIALVLFNWLILGGIGTHLARRCRQASIAVLTACSFALVVLSVGQLAAIRFARPMLFGLGVSAGFYPIFLFSMLALAPYATLVGFVLPYSLFLLRTSDPLYPGVNLYMADNLGDVCGGALFSFGLVFWASPMQAMLGANLLLIVMTFRLVPRPWLGLLGATGALAVLLAGVLTEPYGLRSGIGHLVDTKESRYGRLSVVQDQEQTTLFSDGRPIYATQDRALAEASAHYALSQVRHPRRVLLISGVAGLLQEVSKHGVETIDYVEPDDVLSRLLFRYHLLTAVPGLHLIHADGRVWLRDTSRRYDAILVNLPEPDTLQLNRFFTGRFYALVRSRLTPQGVFSFSVEGFDNYMNTAEQESFSILPACPGAPGPAGLFYLPAGPDPAGHSRSSGPQRCPYALRGALFRWRYHPRAPLRSGRRPEIRCAVEHRRAPLSHAPGFQPVVFQVQYFAQAFHCCSNGAHGLILDTAAA